ncbi:uncharacterized protein PHACADRAFT_101159 [Phanerochaete carnosa HHB-10118-sp]|uniref:Uncharacterized protein n=1 Tax=Phanerochaete carnosa (strain HHB-10118-sp) TaxID=650164 RepID=K5WPI5_PHACS|nr:uncharacterized protein PHACADRAFT_101159 [Phanerochaete carnosa HHB-10118-sp]EKM52257.1 hypothetical protein PHACADRAFT_101159 [Phanerochaete carnosa HHB-10118-sp]
MNGIKYRGHSNLLKQSEHKLIVPKRNHYFLKKFGNDHCLYARMTRFMTGHFPHGEFQNKMNLEGGRTCLCTNTYETQDHILYECPYWIRTDKIRPPKRAPDQTRLELISAGKQLELQNKEQVVTIDEIHNFLLLTPLVRTFKWQDLMEHMQLDVFPLRDNDNPDYESHIINIVFDALVLQRPTLYTEYKRAMRRNKSPAPFLQWLNAKSQWPIRHIWMKYHQHHPNDQWLFQEVVPDWLRSVFVVAHVPLKMEVVWQSDDSRESVKLIQVDDSIASDPAESPASSLHLLSSESDWEEAASTRYTMQYIEVWPHSPSHSEH